MVGPPAHLTNQRYPDLGLLASPIFLSFPLTTATAGTPSEAPVWPHQPSSLTRPPLFIYPTRAGRLQRDDLPLRPRSSSFLEASNLHCGPTQL